GGLFAHVDGRERAGLGDERRRVERGRGEERVAHDGGREEDFGGVGPVEGRGGGRAEVELAELREEALVRDAGDGFARSALGAREVGEGQAAPDGAKDGFAVAVVDGRSPWEDGV